MFSDIYILYMKNDGGFTSVEYEFPTQTLKLRIIQVKMTSYKQLKSNLTLQIRAKIWLPVMPMVSVIPM